MPNTPNAMDAAALQLIEQDFAQAALLARAAQLVRGRAVCNLAALEARCAPHSGSPAAGKDRTTRTPRRRRMPL